MFPWVLSARRSVPSEHSTNRLIHVIFPPIRAPLFPPFFFSLCLTLLSASFFSEQEGLNLYFFFSLLYVTFTFSSLFFTSCVFLSPPYFPLLPLVVSTLYSYLFCIALPFLTCFLFSPSLSFLFPFLLFLCTLISSLFSSLSFIFFLSSNFLYSLFPLLFFLCILISFLFLNVLLFSLSLLPLYPHLFSIVFP